MARDLWTIGLPIRPRALIRAGHTLFVGGTSDTSAAETRSVPPNVPSEEKSKGALLIASCSDGKTLDELQLDTPPVWDGIAAARGRLYVATTGGSLVCLGPSKIPTTEPKRCEKKM
jgi:hypothetical protein